MYSKVTDTQQFLDSTSCHGKSCKKAIPYSQTIKIKTIASLVDRWYNHEKVWKGICRVNGTERENLLRKKDKVTMIMYINVDFSFCSILCYQHSSTKLHSILWLVHNFYILKNCLLGTHARKCASMKPSLLQQQ